MKKTLFKAFMLGCIAFQSNFADAQNPTWILAPNYLDGNSPPIPLPTFGPSDSDPLTGYDSQPAERAQNIQTDANGNIMFFIVDKYIYGRNGELVEVLRVVDHEIESVFNNEILVLPDNVDCNLFHIMFSASNTDDYDVVNPYYCKLKLSYNSEGVLNERSGFVHDPSASRCEGFMQPLEDIIPNYDSDEDHVQLPVFFAASIQPQENYYVFISSNGKIHILEIGNGDVNFLNTINIGIINTQDLNFMSLDNYEVRNISEMEVVRLSNGNFRVALAVDMYFPLGDPNGTQRLSVYTFDISSLSFDYIVNTYRSCAYTGVSAPYASNTKFASGIELSRNGERVYVSHAPFEVNGSTLDYWDISQPNYINNSPNRYTLSTDEKFGHGQIETKTNGDMYIASNNELALITNTNTTPVFNGTGSVTISNYGLSSPPPTYDYYGKYLLQDQVDDLDYSTVAPKRFDAFVYSHTTPTSTIWKPNTSSTGYGNNPLIYGFGSIAYIEKELRVKAGTNLTIENMTILFAPGARLVVENAPSGQQGGKLLLKNSTLNVDDRCGSNAMWLGVEIWGNQHQSQGSLSNSSQGFFRMFNDSRIENAKIGVLLGKRNSTEIYSEVQTMNCVATQLYEDMVHPTSFDDTRNGGIIQANQGSTFSNNQIGVFFRAHNSPSNVNNLSFFDRATFVWDNNLIGNATPQYHLFLNQVKGINIAGTDFLQNSPQLYTEDNQGFGIYSAAAQFSVNSTCSSVIPIGGSCPPANVNRSTFSSLTYGINTLSSTAIFNGYTCNQSEFINCRYGIASLMTDNAKITLNNFQVREATYQTAGVSLSHSKYYTIQENDFNEFNNASIPTANIQSYGVRIHNGGAQDEEVYKNTFQNLRIGGISERVNASAILPNNGSSGLNWLCNTFISNIHEADLGINGVIDYHQGTVATSTVALAQSSAARNSFSITTNTGTEHDIKMYNPVIHAYPNSQDISYVHLDHPNHIANDKDNFISLTVAQSGGLNVVPIGNTCPTKKDIVKKPMLVSYRFKTDSLSGIIAGGNTPELLYQSYSEAEENATYTNLMHASPYLSDEVLLNYLERCTQSGKVKDVMVYNSPLTSAVKEAVAISSLPTAVKNTIYDAQRGRSERTKVELALKQNKESFTITLNDLVNEIALDTTIVGNTDSLISLLKPMNTIEAKRMLAGIYMQNSDFGKVELLIDEIEGYEDADYIVLLENQIALQQYPSYEAAVLADESLKEDLENLALSNNNFVAQSALNVLSIISGVPREVEEFLPLDGPSAISIYSDEQQAINASEQQLIVHIYPNPSTGNVYFDLPDHEEGTMQIQLFDLSGKEVYTTAYYKTNGELVDFSKVEKGTYIVRIVLGESYTESQLLQLKD